MVAKLTACEAALTGAGSVVIIDGRDAIEIRLGERTRGQFAGVELLAGIGGAEFCNIQLGRGWSGGCRRA